MSAPTIEILYFEGCPGYAAVVPAVRRIAGSEGARVEQLAIVTTEHAEEARFLGSPTVRINGVDVDASAVGRTDYGVKCRLYVTPEGSQHSPPEAWIRAALRRSRERADGA
jgi:hypothetical protein